MTSLKKKEAKNNELNTKNKMIHRPTVTFDSLPISLNPKKILPKDAGPILPRHSLIVQYNQSKNLISNNSSSNNIQLNINKMENKNNTNQNDNVPVAPPTFNPRPSQLIALQPLSSKLPNAPSIEISVPSAPFLKIKGENIPDAPKAVKVRPSQLLAPQPLAMNLPKPPELNLAVPAAPFLKVEGMENVPKAPELKAPRPSQLIMLQPLSATMPNAPNLQSNVPLVPDMRNIGAKEPKMTKQVPGAGFSSYPQQSDMPRPSELIAIQPLAMNMPKAPALNVVPVVPIAPKGKKQDINNNNQINIKTLKSGPKFVNSKADKMTPKEKEISALKTQVAELQKKVTSLKNNEKLLKSQNELLTKKSVDSSVVNRMSLINTRRKSALDSLRRDPGLQLAILAKEKDDLQEINAKMLGILTEKEVENKDIRDEYDKYKKESRENEHKFIEHIQNLEDEILNLKITGAAARHNIEGMDDLMNDYNNYRSKTEKELERYISAQEKLREQSNLKTQTIRKLNADIQKLELENLNNMGGQGKKGSKADIRNNLEKEVQRLKDQIKNAEEKKKMKRDDRKANLNYKEEDLKELGKKYEELKESMKKKKEEYAAQIEKLKSELNKKDMTKEQCATSIESLQKQLEEEKKLLAEVQGTYDKKTNDLTELNTNTTKTLENNEESIKKYEQQIIEMSEDKTKMIEANKALLNEIKGKIESSGNEKLRGCRKLVMHENKLLNQEVKVLRDKMEVQANDLVALSAMEQQLTDMKEENEKMNKDLTMLQERNKLLSETGGSMADLSKQKPMLSNKQKQKRHSFMPTEIPFATKGKKNDLEKRVADLKAAKDKETKEYSDKLDKLKDEIALQKVKYLNEVFENESLIAKYRNIIHQVKQKCKKQGINLNMKINV